METVDLEFVVYSLLLKMFDAPIILTRNSSLETIIFIYIQTQPFAPICKGKSMVQKKCIEGKIRSKKKLDLEKS